MADPLIAALRDARTRTEELVLDLDEARWTPAILWELGHLAWFQATWVLGAQGDPAFASVVPPGARGTGPVPDTATLLGYAGEVMARAIEVAQNGGRRAELELAILHEDLHGEGLVWARQASGMIEPRWSARSQVTQASRTGAWPGDVEVPGGDYWLGALPSTPEVVLDDEKWAHRTQVATFRIARAPVTNEEYARFVEAIGHPPPPHWTRRGREWRTRRWDREEPLSPYQPVVHVSWHDAQAYCAWAGRRLPSEAEWELAASSHDKRPMPWGDAPLTRAHANLDARAGRLLDVAACPDGDGPYGCRQMIGNVWEWTASTFEPYEGHVAGPSAARTQCALVSPHRVLRGGSWATRGRTLRTTSREPQPPDRRDGLFGFRTCAV